MMSRKHNRRSIRLPGYDYTQPGAYFVTVCTHQNRRMFGHGADGGVALNLFGTVTETKWRRITEANDHVMLDAFVVMPNHLHAVIVILSRKDDNPHERWASGESVPSPYDDAGGDTMSLGQLVTCKSGSLGAIIGNLKSVVTRKINDIRHTPGEKVWQRNYYERIVRDERELARIRAYIVANPARWTVDRYYDAL
jgi:REP element-mobilizing transposase RayT